MEQQTTNNSGQGPEFPPDANVFRVSAKTTLIVVIAMLMAVIEAILLFAHAWYTTDPTTRITQIPAGLFCALVAELNWRILSRSRARIAVNAQGIWQRRDGSTSFIAWDDLTGILANDMQQRLELTDRYNAVSIRIDYQTGSFERLRAFMLSHSSERVKGERPAISIFHHRRDNQIVYATIAALLFFFAWYMQHSAGFPVSACVVSGAIMLFLFLREPIALVIGHNGIAIRYLIFQSDISFDSITGIEFNDVRYRSNFWAAVRIIRRNGSRIRLSRFREGSVALYEALQKAWQLASDKQGAAIPPPATRVSTTPSLQVVNRQRFNPSRLGIVAFAFFAIAITAVAMIVGLGRTRAGRALSESLASRAQIYPAYPLHQGPVAPLSHLHGNGTVYLVQMGPHAQPYSLTDFSAWLHDKYAIDAKVLPAMTIDPSAWDARRKQFVAEQLYAQIKQHHPDLALNPDAFLIGFTDADMYSDHNMWSSSFTQRDNLRAAVISSEGMGDTRWQRAHLPAAAADDRFRDRMRRILLKDVAMLYWHLPLNEDPTSLLHNPLDPDIPANDIFESDLNPALSAAGDRVYEPCVYFTYSDKAGIALLPGPVVRGCSEILDPMQDESMEVFEVVLRFGLLIDKHTDLYLPDTIPIEFQRATRDGGFGKEPFGVSGSDNYDELLGSADNIHVFVRSGDGTDVDLNRVPEWLSILPLIKYAGGEEACAWTWSLEGGYCRTIWEYQMAWHALPYEHYDLQRYNGETKTFLPCGSAPGLDCMLIDYHNSQGRELRIDRDSLRRLARVTSPNGSWVSADTDNDRRILAVHDSAGRTVQYGYDAAHNLTTVTYPSAEAYHYTYDDKQHILSVAVTSAAQSEPRLVLKNEYQNNMLAKMMLPDGSVYEFDYNSSDRMKVHHATIHTPDGRIFNVGIGNPWAIVHEAPAPIAGIHK